MCKVPGFIPLFENALQEVMWWGGGRGGGGCRDDSVVQNKTSCRGPALDPI